MFYKKDEHEHLNYRVELPPAIKGMITALESAVDTFSWAGSLPPEAQEDAKTGYLIARYNLERTIATYLRQGDETASMPLWKRRKINGGAS